MNIQWRFRSFPEVTWRDTTTDNAVDLRTRCLLLNQTFKRLEEMQNNVILT